MTLKSMTGFARGQGEAEGYRWTLEAKSVNGKGLDVRARVPSVVDGLDIALKKQAAAALGRGTVYINLTLENVSNSETFTINRDKLDQLIQLGAEYEGHEGVEVPRLDGLPNIKGVLEAKSDQLDEQRLQALNQAIITGSAEIIDQLISARSEEGARMAIALNDQIDTIESLTNEAKGLDTVRMEAIKQRFQDNVAKLLDDESNINQDRLEQEIATLAVKADIREEIDRLESHIVEARNLLGSDEAVGRRMDFLAQEFNREANTLCSKSSDVELTRIGLALKTLIDQFREQIQNIE